MLRIEIEELTRQARLAEARAQMAQHGQCRRDAQLNTRARRLLLSASAFYAWCLDTATEPSFPAFLDRFHAEIPEGEDAITFYHAVLFVIGAARQW